ncbi:MAG: hypothetical protein QOG64_3313, partial [Acidimicrobiaceae bacterium]|nr:hypothetical protein [Acidimicrobiaceae bacterium]
GRILGRARADQARYATVEMGPVPAPTAEATRPGAGT